MKFYFLIFVLFLQISSFYSFLNPSDFCKKGSANMKKCMVYDCDTQFCALNKQTCKNLRVWATLVKKYAKKPKVYAAFIKSIKPCSTKKIINKWTMRF
jgi:hypothetical protein